MTLGPNPAERLNRARADLRMGVPVVLSDAGTTTLFAAAEGIGSARLAMIRSLGAPVLALTDRRAATLKVAAYDGDLVRLHLPPDADTLWVRDMADPSHDLAHPMKGPFRPLRDGSATLARTALLIAKSAHLLPAVLLVDLAMVRPSRRITGSPFLIWHKRCRNWPRRRRSCRLPMPACRLPPRRPGVSTCFARRTAARITMPSKSAHPTALCRFWRGSIPPASPATFWAA